MADLPVPAGTIMRVRSTGQPRLYVTQGRQSAGNMFLRTTPKPTLVRVPGPTGPPGPAGGAEVFAFSGSGTEYVRVGHHKVVLETDYTVDSVRATVGTPPLGTPLIVDVLVDGVSIYSNPAHRPTIAPTGTSALGGPVGTTLPEGGVMTVNVAAVGAVQPGADLVVVVRLTPAP